jgi:glucosamine-6-phosphate deaminase
MNVRVFANKAALSRAAAAQAARLIRGAIAERGAARILVATGESQIAFL